MPAKNPRVVLALLLPFVACALQWLLWDFLQPFAYLLFYPTVYLSSRLGGKRAGVPATVISALLIVYFFIPPRFSFLVPQGGHLVSVLIFVVMGGLFGYSQERLQQACDGETDARAVARNSEAELREARIQLLEMERRLAQERLRETEEQFRIMFMESSVGEARLDPDSGAFLKVNPAFCRMTGYSESELLRLDLVAVTRPEDRDACLESLKSLGERGRGAVQTELGLLRRDGASVYCQATLNPLPDSGGHGNSVLAVLQDVSGRRQAEEALLKSEEKFFRAFSGNPAAIALTRLEDGVFLDVNETWATLTGYSREEVIGRSGRHMWPDPETVQRFLGQLRSTGTLRGWEQPFLRKNGETFVTQLSSQVLSVGGEEVILSTLVDITQLKEVEAALRESENRFRTIFDYAPLAIGIGAVDDGRLLDVNPAWLRLLGFERDEVLGRTALELGLYPDGRKRKEIVAALQPGHGFTEELQLKRKSGEVIDVLFSADVVVLDGSPCLLVMLNDVTVQKQAERALIEASQFNQQIIAGAQEGIIVYDRELRCQVWNPYMEQLTGILAQDILGRHPREAFPSLEESGIVAKLARALEGAESSSVEFRFTIDKTGRSGWATDTRAPLRDAKGEIIGVITTVRDITAERRLEEQLRQAQKMEAVGLLAGGVAHDFNNVLQVIMGYCSLLTGDTELHERQKDEVEQILVSAERAAQLTKGLLAFSRKQVMEPRRVNLCDVVQHVQKFLVRIIGEDIILQVVRCPRPELPVIADSGQVEQVLINLATNARDAMPKGGSLTVETEVVEVAEPMETQFGHHEPGSYACIIMVDTGSGMDEETRTRIFEPFFTTKEVGKGTGLGMAIVYGIVKQHGGFVTVYSEPDRGTTFRIYLPLAKDGAAGQSEQVELPPPRGGTETLLLAEDDVDVRRLLVTILTKFGYRVIEAGDGQQAVDLFAAYRDSIALVVMDVIMPKKNGVEAGGEILQLRPGVKILYASGYTSDFMARRGILEQGIQLINKPVQPVQLLRKVREMLDA